MMALADIPMIVLFGPTNSEKFAPKNNYTKILDSKKLHRTKRWKKKSTILTQRQIGGIDSRITHSFMSRHKKNKSS